MARSQLFEDQIRDEDFLSEEEGYTISGTLQVQIDAKPDRFIELLDTPDIYSAGMYLRSTSSGIEVATVQATAEFPRYYIDIDITVLVNDYGQYIINETGYIEIAGTLELGTGSMLEVQRRTVGYIT